MLGQKYTNTCVEKADMLAEAIESNSSDSNFSATFLKHKNTCEKDPAFYSDVLNIEQQGTI